MKPLIRSKPLTSLVAVTALAACSGGLFDRSNTAGVSDAVLEQRQNSPVEQARNRETIWDLFGGGDDPNTTVEVNRYLWNATLDVLDFMPIESVDPFSGVIVFGYGTPPGSGRAYRATVLVRDPALDARSLNVALATRGGAASAETTRAIEDAILTRARQLRIQDGGL